MHRLSIRTLTCNWVFTKTQYAAETLGAKRPKPTPERMADFCKSAKRYLIVLLTNDVAWRV